MTSKLDTSILGITLVAGIIMMILGFGTLGIILLTTPTAAIALRESASWVPVRWKIYNKRQKNQILVASMKKEAVERRVRRNEWLDMNREAMLTFDWAMNDYQGDRSHYKQLPIPQTYKELAAENTEHLERLKTRYTSYQPSPRPTPGSAESLRQLIQPEVVIDPREGAVNTIPQPKSTDTYHEYIYAAMRADMERGDYNTLDTE